MSEQRQRIEITVNGEMMGMDFPRRFMDTIFPSIIEQMRQRAPEFFEVVRFIPSWQFYPPIMVPVPDIGTFIFPLSDTDLLKLILLAAIATEADEEVN